MRTQMVPFAEQNPSLQITTELKRATHPFIRGHYMIGTTKTIGIKNLSPDTINDLIYDLRNQIGRKVLPNKQLK